jgi:L,D-peptidoglycan transpeptidase YkuD (ErfK/YbiS/YcfS/YnhG family)
MIKSFLILLTFSRLLFSSEQIVLVVSDDFNTSHAKLACYEGTKQIFSPIKVNIGKNGLGWGIGEVILHKKASEPFKVEGDNKAPLGVFKLSALFGYATKSDYNMPYLFASKDLICVDDSNSPFYNQIIMAHGDEKSFEFMRRKDNQYKLGIVVEHNKNAITKRGSCIFLHIQKGENKGTAGCTSMKERDIRKIAKWLDKSKKPILIQIPKSSSGEILKLYPELRDSTLLNLKNNSTLHF